MNNENIKENILQRIKTLNKFIREMEDYAKLVNINIQDEKLYIALCSKRKVLKDLLGGR